MRCACESVECHPEGDCPNEADVVIEMHKTTGGYGDPEVDHEWEVNLCAACYRKREEDRNGNNP